MVGTFINCFDTSIFPFSVGRLPPMMFWLKLGFSFPTAKLKILVNCSHWFQTSEQKHMTSTKQLDDIT